MRSHGHHSKPVGFHEWGVHEGKDHDLFYQENVGYAMK